MSDSHLSMNANLMSGLWIDFLLAFDLESDMF